MGLTSDLSSKFLLNVIQTYEEEENISKMSEK